MNFSIDDIRKSIEGELVGVPYILRTDPKRKRLDGCSDGVMANMDAAGNGPEKVFMVGRKVAYEKSSYIKWLVNRIGEHGPNARRVRAKLETGLGGKGTGKCSSNGCGNGCHCGGQQ